MTKCPKMRIENNWLSNSPRPIYLKHDQPSTITQADTEIYIRNNFVPFYALSVFSGSYINVASKWAVIENNIFGIPLDIAVEGGNSTPDGGSYNTISHNTLRLLVYNVADTVPQYNTAKSNLMLIGGKRVFPYHPEDSSKNVSDYNVQVGGVMYGNSTLTLSQFEGLVSQDFNSLQQGVTLVGGADPTAISSPSGFAVLGGNGLGQYVFSNGQTAGADVTKVGVFPVSNINPPSQVIDVKVQ